MKLRFSNLLPVLAALGFTALPAFGGAPLDNNVQVYKATVKSTFLRLDADESEKGTDSTSLYYFQSRSQGAEVVLIVNNKAKTFFVDTDAIASFQLADNDSQFFNIRTRDIRQNLLGNGSLLGKVKSAKFGEVEIDSYTPSLAYQFNTVTSAPALYLSVQDKATLKIDKAMMKRVYADGPANISTAVTTTINFLASKGYQGLP